MIKVFLFTLLNQLADYPLFYLSIVIVFGLLFLFALMQLSWLSICFIRGNRSEMNDSHILSIILPLSILIVFLSPAWVASVQAVKDYQAVSRVSNTSAEEFLVLYEKREAVKEVSRKAQQHLQDAMKAVEYKTID